MKFTSFLSAVALLGIGALAQDSQFRPSAGWLLSLGLRDVFSQCKWMVIDPGFPEHNIADELWVEGGNSLWWRVNIPGGQRLKFSVMDAKFRLSSTDFVTVANSMAAAKFQLGMLVSSTSGLRETTLCTEH
ncbi:hypothetical protein C8Q76DRAFT_785614 [Earliella scabrosa]|nr:hypothetical protein C8Q76DRAFT_785614 [Earliella scabrosa]